MPRLGVGVTVRRSRRARCGPVGCAATARCATAAAPSVTGGIELGRIERGDLGARDVPADQHLNRGDRPAVLGCCQREGAAVAAGPAGATDAMDVILGMVR